MWVGRGGVDFYIGTYLVISYLYCIDLYRSSKMALSWILVVCIAFAFVFYLGYRHVIS